MPKVQARFVMSSPDEGGLLTHAHPEVAVWGRSNVGKSSLLGHLLGAPSMVRTSRTPGRTQLLNLFMVGDRVAFVDLPGYGYAKLSHQDRTRMDRMTRGYIANREALGGVVLLLDARRDKTTQQDADAIALCMARRRPVLLVMTKCDLVPKTKRLDHQRRLERSLNVAAGSALLCSSKTGEGLHELWQRVDELCHAL